MNPEVAPKGLRLVHLLRREARGDVLRAVPVERLDDDGFMRRRDMSANDIPISQSERRIGH